MRGASLISGGASPQHAALVAAYRADPAAREALDADEDPGALLERLRREPTATGRALNDYLEFVGFRLLDGFDISNHYALEMPDVLLRSIRTAIDETGDGLGRRGGDRRGPQPRPRRAPRGVRRPAGGGAHRLQRARRARRLLRHLGVRADAPRRARRGPAARRGRPAARRRGHRVRGHRRDVRAGRGRVGADGRRAGRRATRTTRPTPPRTPRRTWATTRRRCPTCRRSRRRWRG